MSVASDQSLASVEARARVSSPPAPTAPSSTVSLLAGACSGLTVDLVLFPLDTLKTRLQSSNGFNAAGGFRGVYRGLLPAALQSAPTAAVFWLTYEKGKELLEKQQQEQRQSGGWALPATMVHVLAAISGEVAACTTRVPAELVKQRMQASTQTGGERAWAVIAEVYKHHGLRGFYRGYASTVAREIPFCVIQFPLYEALKSGVRSHLDRELNGLEMAACGSVSGGTAAALTTPLDVVKTRIMLDRSTHSRTPAGLSSVLTTLRSVYASGGVSALYAGVVPRVAWISFGGALFFGAFEQAKSVLQ